jgi:hypothetical protein
MTGGGFLHVTPRRPSVSLRQTDTIALSDGCPLLIEVLEGKLLVAGQGHVHEAPFDERLQRAAQRLNSGEPISVGALYRDFVAEEASNDTKPLEELLNALYAMRAIERDKPSAPSASRSKEPTQAQATAEK